MNAELRDKSAEAFGVLKNTWKKGKWGKVAVLVGGLLLWPFVLLTLCSVLYYKFDTPLKRWAAIGLLLFSTLPISSAWVLGTVEGFSRDNEPKKETAQTVQNQEQPSPSPIDQKVASQETESNPSPSVTPVSTATPEPTLTNPTPSVNPVNSIVEAGVYFEKMSELTSTLTDTMGKIGDFSGENSDFTLWTDQERVYYVLLTAIIEESYKEIQTIKPPAQFKKSYNLLSAALKKYAQAMPLTRQGIDEENTDKIYRAISLMDEATELIDKATEQFTNEKLLWEQ